MCDGVKRSDQRWVADFTCVSAWQGFVYVAFIIDVCAGAGTAGRQVPSITVVKVSLAYIQRLKDTVLLAPTGSGRVTGQRNGIDYQGSVIHRQSR